MSRPAHEATVTAFDNRFPLPPMTTLNRDIQALLEGPPAPSLDAIEEALTTGYAHAMGLEGERLRVERRLRAVVREPGPQGGERNRAIAELTRQLADADRELQRLRTLLQTLRQHVLPRAAAG